MNILVLNCGSSSLKYQLINMDDESVLAKGICERIGIDGKLTHKPEGKDKFIVEAAMPDHKVAVKMVLDAIVDGDHGVLSSVDEINAVGHRVVHGGQYCCDSTIVTDEVKKVIKDCFDFAPLHNPANLIGIEACEEVMPEGTPQIAVFDTAFHQTMPSKAFMYALPYEYYEKYGIRKYGFHGTSHSFVSKKAMEELNLDPDNSKIVVCHLGNGSSVSAIVNGKCIDTSMGLTPLEGLIMGTRCGDIDPTLVEFIAHKENLTLEEVMDVLNKKSGVYGLSGGLSSDFRDLEIASDEGNQRAIEAVEVFSYHVAKYVGSYIAAMNGVDAIIFTAGLGENDHTVRKYVASYLGYIGVEFDESKNVVRGGKQEILSTPSSKVVLAVIPTDEELAIARETKELL